MTTPQTTEQRSEIAIPSRLSPVASALVYQPHPFSAATQVAVAHEGATLAEMIASLGLDEAYANHIHVWIDDREVDRAHWPVVRPREGRMVFVRVVPHGGGGGGGKNILRVIGMIAIAVLAVYTGGMAAMAYTGTATVGAATATLGGAMVMAGVATAVSLLGNMALNAIIPPTTPSLDINSGADSSPVSAPRYQLTGVQNRLQQYANIPRVYGRRRVYPLLAAQPYSELQGSDEYLRLALLVGWGPLRLTDIRIGDTPITAYAGVEIETREGWSTDSPLTLFTRSVEQQNFSVVLENTDDVGVWAIRTTDGDTTEISVDIALPSGLAFYNNSGGRDPVTVKVAVEYRVAGTGAWVAPTWTNRVSPADNNGVDDGFGTAGEITITAAEQAAIRRSGRFVVPRGQYDVRVRRATKVNGDRYADLIQWTTLRYVTDSQPIVQKNVALIALRIKATGQLNGVPNSINVVAESYLPVYNGSAWSWAVTRNPAWAFADLLRRRAAETYLTDDRVDLVAIRAWALACDAQAPNAVEPRWTFDGVIEGGSVFQNLKLVASHCRANYTIRDGRHSVVRDVEQTVPVQHITPRNSFGYSGKKSFIDLPHALRVRFVNAALGWQEDEVVVYADGFAEATATRFETLDLPGCTSATQAWREGRYYMAVGKLRPEEHVVSMDIEALRCTLGDYVLFSHDVISVGIASSRIKSLTRNSNNAVTAIVLDDEAYFDPGVVRTYVLRVRSASGSTSLISLVSTGVGSTEVVYPLTPIAANVAPSVGDLVMFGESARETAPMMVRRIEPGPNLTARVSLVDAQPGVWTADVAPIPEFNSYITTTTPTSEAKPGLPGIGSIRSDETVLLRAADGTLVDRVYIEIIPPASGIVRTESYEVQYRAQGATNWLSTRVGVDAPTVYLTSVQAGNNYEIRVRAISAASIAGDWAPTVLHYVIGKTTPPSAPSDFAALGLVDGVQLSWVAAPDIDVVGYRVKRGVDWSTAALVTDKVVGTSLFVGLDTAGAQTFLIRSVDAVGLESLQTLSVSTSTAAPDDVTGFSVYAREDYVAASWTPVYGVGVVYEVRSGDSWSVGTIIGRTAGDKLEVKFPVKTAGDVTYWIKALSPTGLYSTSAVFASTRQAPIPNRNVVVTRDWTALGYPGVKLDLSVNASALEVEKIGGISSSRGDYYAEIVLPVDYYARSWTEISALSVSNSGATWATSSFSWDLAGTATWQGQLGDVEAGTATVYIARFLGTLPPGVIEGWRLADSPNGVAGTTPSAAQDLVYAPCHFANGLESLGSTRASWNVAIPAVFSTVFDFRADTFVDQDQVLLTLRAGTGYLRLVYDAQTKKFSLVDHVGYRADVSLAFASGDVLTFGISQSLTSRALYAATRRNPHPVSASITVSPVGNFTQLALTA
jgi:hypothetical protein